MMDGPPKILTKLTNNAVATHHTMVHHHVETGASSQAFSLDFIATWQSVHASVIVASCLASQSFLHLEALEEA
jgi:hypothetical protein